MSIRPANDGFRARVWGSWTREKLVYLRKYASAFMTAMGPKRDEGKWRELVFIDLLAGTGVCIDETTGEEFSGSPLIALDVEPRFDRLFLGDLDRENVDALRHRIPQGDLSRVDLKEGDCNTRVQEVVTQLSRRTLGLAFLDPQGFEVDFTTLQALAQRAVDVVFLFPSGIGIRRNLRAFVKQTDSPMDRLWGSREWRKTLAARVAAGIRIKPEEAVGLDGSWVVAFRKRVAQLGFVCQDSSDPCISNNRHVPMYHLLFFSKHPAGLKIWQGIKKIEATGQRTLPL